MIKKNIAVKGSKILILGITFKENCPDVRNTKVVDLVNSLKSYATNVTIHDPWANEKEVMSEYELKSYKSPPDEKFDAIVLTVAHSKFHELDLLSLKNNNAIIYDVKNFLDKSLVNETL